jgi:hypothetical protein
VAAKFRIEDSLLLVHGVVPMRAAPFGHGLEGPSKALLHSLGMDRELPSPAERAPTRQDYRANKFSEAMPLAQRALAIVEKAFGPNHPNLAPSLYNLAGLYRAQLRYADAEPL